MSHGKLLSPLSVVVFGDINADLTMQVPAYPAEGDDSTAHTLRWGSGGTALNAAAAFALLGGKVRLLGRVGADPAAAVALRAADIAGVDLSAVQRDTAVATGLCSTMVSASGQRTFFCFRGANVTFDPAAITPSLVQQAHLLYVSAYGLLEGSQRRAALRAFDLAATLGVPITLDLGVPPARLCRELILELLPQLWLLAMNEDEFALLVPGQRIGEALDSLLACGVTHVALKRGARGCVVANAGTRVDMLPPIVSAIDTNGCGDAFTAAFAWALLNHAGLQAGATFGNLLGALTATRLGAADALPARAELLRHLDPALHFLIAGGTQSDFLDTDSTD